MLNKIILQGRLTECPELKQTPTGKAVTRFSVAVEDSRTVNGERNVSFFKIEAWNISAEFICKYFEKGQQILVEGRLAVNSYTDKNDNKRKDVYIIAESVNFCGAKSNEAIQNDIENLTDEDLPFID